MNTIQPLTDHPLAFLVSVAFVLLMEIPVTRILRAIAKAHSIDDPPRGADKATWQGISAIQGPVGGQWIGRLERILLFISILLAPGVTAAWLAFKVASKWEAWSNLYKVPDSLPRVNSLEYLRARMALGSRTYQRFLAGTAANLLAAFLAAALFGLLPGLAPWL